MKARISLVIVLLLVILQAVPVAALEIVCPQGNFWEIATEIANRYSALLGSVEEEGLQRAASFQGLRRCLDELQPRSAEMELSDVLQNALNLAADSIVSGLIGETDDAALLQAQANQVHQRALEIIVAGPIIIPNAGTIESPAEGESAPEVAQIIGTRVDSELNEDNHLWLFVVTPNNLTYPQGNNMCVAGERTPIPFNAFDDGWSMTVGLGDATSVGQQFTLVLVTVDAVTHAFLNRTLDQWCAANSFVGLTQQELFTPDHVINTVQVVHVIRE